MAPAISINFVTEKIGFIGGTDKIWKTNDGGKTWTIVYNSAPKIEKEDFFHHITMVNQKTGYAIGFKQVLKTKDSGNTWGAVLAKEKNVFSMAEPSFSSKNEVYIAALNSIYTSSNTGISWKEIPWTIYDDELRSVIVVDSRILVGSAKGDIYESTDKGRNWKKVGKNTSVWEKTNESEKWPEDGKGAWAIHTLKVFPSGIGYSINLVGGVSKTEDGGKTWEMVRHPVPTPPLDELIKLPDPFIETFHWSALVFDENRVFIPSDGGELLYTHDGGKSWNRAKVILLDGKKSSDDLRSVSMIDANKGWIVSLDGGLYKTGDGGKTWKQQTYRVVDK